MALEEYKRNRLEERQYCSCVPDGYVVGRKFFEREREVDPETEK